MKTTTLTLGNRVTALEGDSLVVHTAIDELSTRIHVLEQLVERGFASLERRFDVLVERLDKFNTRFTVAEQNFNAFEKKFDRLETWLREKL